MEDDMPYCPLVGKCPHFPVEINSNKCFLIEPWDDLRKIRREKIENSLKAIHPHFQVITCDIEQGIELYCDICKKIQNSIFCVADLSPKDAIIDSHNQNIEKIFIRPNITLEIGLALAFHKPVFIITQKKKKGIIPSDLNGFLYILTNESLDELELKFKQKLPYLKKYIRNLQVRNINIQTKNKMVVKIIKNHICYSQMQEESPNNIKIIQFNLLNNKITAIIKKSNFKFILGLWFQVFLLKDGVEIEFCSIEITHIQEKLVQAKIIQKTALFDKLIGEKLVNYVRKTKIAAPENIIRIPKHLVNIELSRLLMGEN